MNNNSGKNRRGFALVLSLLTTSVSLILMMAYISRVVADYGFTAKIYNSTVALDLAEAGVERALWEIVYNSSTFSGWATNTDVGGNVTKNISITSFQNSGGDTMGDYDVNAWLSVDGMNATITCTGYVPQKVSYKSRKTVTVKYSRHNFSFGIGAAGTAGIVIGNNSLIDSYNSDIGPYSVTHANSDGNIATNGPITITGNAKVYGNANPGADYPFSSKPAGVSGSWGTLQAPLVFDPIPPATLAAEKASGLAAPGHGVITVGETGSYTRTDDNLVVDKPVTFTGGSYYFKSITVNKQGIINISAQSTIYVDGGNMLVNKQGDLNVYGQTTFYVDGGNITIETQGDINTTGAPKNLTLYSTGTNITIITQTDFFGAIYAPNAAISLTSATAGGEIYGSVTCSSFVSGTNTAVHFDKALLNVSPVFANSGVTYWQET